MNQSRLNDLLARQRIAEQLAEAQRRRPALADPRTTTAGEDARPPARRRDGTAGRARGHARGMVVIVGMDRVRTAILRRRMRSDPVPTFIFADLVGYTALTEELGDEAAAVIAREFARKMRELSRKHGARQVKSMGDSVMIWSRDAANAVALAADAIDNAAAAPNSPLVRVGVHTGHAVLRGSDWYGSAVNVAARLADQARPGEALISGATHSAAHGELMHPLRTRRELALRGIERPVVAWALT